MPHGSERDVIIMTSMQPLYSCCREELLRSPEALKQKVAVVVFMKGNETFVSLPTDPYSALLTLIPEPLNLDPQRQQLVSIISIVAYLHVRACKTGNCTSLTLHILHVI